MVKQRIHISADKQIEFLIRARYSLIYIVSSEETRVETVLKQIALNRSKKVFFWSITQGLQGDDNFSKDDLREPLKTLDFIDESDSNGFFVLRDFHPFLQDAVVIRRLRDLNKSLKTQANNKNIIILSPMLKIPQELEKEMSIIQFDLPRRDELNKIIGQVIRLVDNPETIEVYNDIHKREKVLEAALGLTSEEAENVFARSIVQTGQFDINIILSEKEQIIRKSGVLEFYKTDEDIENVGGLENLKTWLHKRTNAFTPEARDFGLPQPKGILLIGIPGCGKSLTAKAISNLWRLPLLKLDVGRVFSSLVGSSEENVRNAISTAEAIAPSILWLDELEKGFSGIQSSGATDAGTSARVFGTFITWMQEKTSPVFVVATANNVSQLPPELIRKGRFDEIFYIDLPNKAEREKIFKIHIEKRKRDIKNFNIPLLAEKTSGYSGAEIEQIVISALYDAFDSGIELSDERLLHSISELFPLSQTMSEEINRIRTWAKNRARKASEVTFSDEIFGEESQAKLEI
ncbi:MAG: AAA family ATPase [Spirochaetes bacterium]|nr:AAA family ATPase [Spirochaetota bacterium]